MASNETPKYKLSVVEGTELQLSLLGPTGPAGVSGTITTSTSTNLTGYIFGNGTNIAGAVEASSAGSPNTLVLRNASGAAEFNANNEGEAAVSAYSAGSVGAGVYAVDFVGDGYGVYAEGFIGVYGSSNNQGTGVVGYSENGTGGESISTGTLATYHHKFGNIGNNRSAVERVRGWFVWFYNGLVGRLKTADITASRDWTLPNATGTIALIDSSQTFSQSQTFSGAFEITNASVKLSAIPTFADNSAASSLATGSVYKTSTGELRIKY